MVDEHYLELLSKDYPSIEDASFEIIKLSAILNLPKGTEYFFSDLHGEHEAFLYMLKSASGVIREKIDWIYGKNTVAEREELAKLIIDPENYIATKKQEDDFDEWCRVTIYKLIEVCKSAANKYTRSKVRKRLPEGFAYIIDELLHADDEANKEYYYSEIIHSLITEGMAEGFMIAISTAISKLCVDRLHIIGDIFDRGPHPDLIMDYLVNYDNVDFQWGNHDVFWMGAAIGNWVCLCNALRISISYNNFDMLEIGYGINLRPLAVFAKEIYKDDDCKFFKPHVYDENKYDPIDLDLAAKMHKAIAILQFKIEGQISKLHPEFNLEPRVLLDKINFENNTVRYNGKDYPLRDTNFPTVDPKDPLKLTDEEKDLMERLAASFISSPKLQSHIRFLLSRGSLYSITDNNLLYHGCIPMTEDGEFVEVSLKGKTYKGKKYFDAVDKIIRKCYSETKHDPFGGSELYWLWSGGESPFFGKDIITTFQRYFIEEKETHKETTNPYYRHINEKSMCLKILEEFGLDETAHIINGHVPVKKIKGESPIKGGGRLIVIDGGMAKSYQKSTGIAGYTLISNSRYLALAEHKPYTATGINEIPTVRQVESFPRRVTVEDTDFGKKLKGRIEELRALIDYYKKGI